MEIRRRAARKGGAEWLTLVPDQDPQVTQDPASGRVLLLFEDVPSPRDEGSHYDCEVYLNSRDIERLRAHLLPKTEQMSARDEGQPGTA